MTAKYITSWQKISIQKKQSCLHRGDLTRQGEEVKGCVRADRLHMIQGWLRADFLWESHTFLRYSSQKAAMKAGLPSVWAGMAFIWQKLNLAG